MGVNCSRQKGLMMIHDSRDALNYKLLLLGDHGVGKTSVFSRFVNESFPQDCRPTNLPVVRNVFKKVNVPGDYVVSVTIWDVPILEDIDMRHSYYRNVDAVIVVSDITDEDSIRMSGTWRQDFVNKATRSLTVTEIMPNGNIATTMEKTTCYDPYKVPFLLLGNKYDKIEQAAAFITESVLPVPGSQAHLESENLTSQGQSQGVLPVREDVTWSCDVPANVKLLQDTAEKHEFLGSILVSARQADGSVDLAFQTLLRHLLGKSRQVMKLTDVAGATKHHTVISGDTKPHTIFPKRKQNQYVKFCGVPEIDKIYQKCVRPIKRADDLQNYYGIVLRKFQQLCLDNGFVYDSSSTLEDYILGLNKALLEMCNVTLEIEHEDPFLNLVVMDTEVPVPEEIDAAVKLFNTEFVRAGSCILVECPLLDSMFEDLMAALEGVEVQLQEEHGQNAALYANICRQNQVRLAFARKQATQCLTSARNAVSKVKAALIW